ncbi:MAG: hypothetical protein AB1425_02245 [Actinomycetota bacterium]
MSSYAEIARRRKRARALYLELRALGLDVRVEEDPGEPLSFRVVVGGLRSLSPAHADRVVRRVRGNEAGLARILLGGPWNPDLAAIRQEGGCS